VSSAKGESAFGEYKTIDLAEGQCAVNSEQAAFLTDH
jgi:hypothetical protein